MANGSKPSLLNTRLEISEDTAVIYYCKFENLTQVAHATRIYGESKIIGGSTIIPEDFWWNTINLWRDEDFWCPKIYGSSVKDFWCQRVMVFQRFLVDATENLHTG